ncbi:MAG: MG2 domain-containing protein, partial [Pseudomonadota bacterium]|nr:MG2 domain-containing protein [Pseudomonadota bacterium]
MSISKTIAALLAAGALQVQALQITSVSPQGEISRVRQVVAKFDDSAVNFGDPKAPAPLSLSCNDAQATKGTGRWLNDRQWVFDFENDLPPGVRCSLQVVPTFQSPKSQAISGKASYAFSTGGPFVQTVRPSTSQRIDEEQYFVLQLNGPATLASIRDNVWCAVEGLGERVPVKLIEGAERAALLKSLNLDKAASADPLRLATLACNRRLTAASKLQLVYGKGVTTPDGVANSVEKRYTFQVREPFTASFSCERENAQAACLPIRAMRLDFNAPVSRKLLEGIRLKSAKDTLKPVFDAEGDSDNVLSSVNFKPPLAEQTPYTLELPRDFKDASGRPLNNADRFPLKVATGAMPPLAKFAAAPFGIVERFAEPGAKAGDPALLPVTLRNVETALKVQGLVPATGKVSDLQPRTDADIIAWFRKVQRYDDYQIERKVAALEIKGALPKIVDEDNKEYVQSRMLSLLAGQPGVKTLDLPQPASGDPRPFEVVGIPLSPGFHVIEIASQKLGSSLLDERHGASRTMYVRTSALVTNLGVHFKLGRENALAWVTSLDKGAPVAGATVRVSSCGGQEIARAVTNTQGIASFKGLASEPPRCSGEDYRNAYFISARVRSAGPPQASTAPSGGGALREAKSVGAQSDMDSVEDMSFTWSDWHKGIEPWRFNVPTSRDTRPDQRAHTIFDRALLRAGETVSMKHLIRTETSQGFGLTDAVPDKLVVTHTGSGQQYVQPLDWRKTATGGQSAESTFAIPPAAKLGEYQVELRLGSRAIQTGVFRVEEFRLPVLEGRIQPSEKMALVNVKAVPTDVQINYVSSGGAANLPVRVSALLRSKNLSYSDHDAFN